MNITQDLIANSSVNLPWIYDLGVEDANWVITSSFMIFTMQTGFGMLESGCVSIKNEVNIMMKNVVDIVLGGMTYWIFGFGLSFGRSSLNNGFIAFGDFFTDPSPDSPIKGPMYAAFLFQLSFATTATTIVSGAMAERCNFKAYCIFSFLNTAIYCIPAGWIWGEHGFLKKMGAVDIAGSGAVHLIGGSSAMASAMMLGPRLGRYDNGINPLPLGNPVNAVMGLFVLWWGWLAFNSGSTYGLTGEKWHYAAKAAVMTMMSTFGGGTISIIYSLANLHGKINTMDIINGILGALVSVTAGCFLYQAWEAIVVGIIGAMLVLVATPLFDLMGIDDPVGASAVHGVGGIWGDTQGSVSYPILFNEKSFIYVVGVLAVGIFASDPVPLDTTSGRSGVLRGGGWYLLGVQALAALCLASWGVFSSIILLWCINKVITIRVEVHTELLGADITEHMVKHRNVGVSRALSALKSYIDTTSIEKMDDVGSNPMHTQKVEQMKEGRKRNHKFSRVIREVTRNRNFGINLARNLVPKRRKRKTQENQEKQENHMNNGTYTRNTNGTQIPVIRVESADTVTTMPPQMAWVN